MLMDRLVRPGRAVLVWILLLVMLCSWFNSPLQAEQISSPGFFSDRAADIVNASPLNSDYIFPGGLTGQGQIVGIADSGLDKGSLSSIIPDLKSEDGRMPRVAMLKSYTDRALPDDPVGHGTHMAGIIAASGASSQGKYRGLAPGSALYFQALLDKQNNIRVPSAMADLFMPAYQAGVRIHVNGWGSGGNSYQASTRQIDQFVFEYNDFLPLFGSGNSGPNAGSLSSEANSKNALVIGSSQVPRPALDIDNQDTSQITASSSRGPAQDGRIKPDLLAPGSSVISTCSSLVESNFPANGDYTVMGGSSMATAVTGAALALLCEYLQDYRDLDNPSAALLKALLINGARSLPASLIPAQGFGILDIGNTVLSLADRSSKYVDNARVTQGEAQQYRFVMDKPGQTFKATLAWTDPPAGQTDSQTLVNNLDLMVIAPNGSIYYGNDFRNTGTPDRLNNVEQVQIPDAAAGEYTVTVTAAGLSATSVGQSFALAYGEILRHSTVTGVQDGKLVLDNGDSFDQARLFSRENNKLSASLAVGAEIYWDSKMAYLFNKEWESGGVQLIDSLCGSIIMESSPLSRDGGYYLEEDSIRSGRVWVNGTVIQDSSEFLTGAHIQASVNPLNQLLWQVNAAAVTVNGNISRVDKERRQIWLLNQDEPYTMEPWGDITASNNMVGAMREALPYGYAENLDIDHLIPGMRVKLLVTPQTRRVNYATVERELVIARIDSLGAADSTVITSTGGEYGLFPGASLYRDGQPVTWRELSGGDYMIGLLLPGTEKLLQVQAFSEVVYGRVIYYNETADKLYLFDNNNKIRECSLSENSQAFRWGSIMARPAFEPGSWLRVIFTPEGRVNRLDMAETSEQVSKILAGYDPARRRLTMTDGSSYQCEANTLVASAGFAVGPEDLAAGRPVKVTLLSGGGDADILAAVEAFKDTGAAAPLLSMKISLLNGALVIHGNSSAERVALYRQDGSRVGVQPQADGSFSLLLHQLPDESKMRAVAVDATTGAVASIEVQIDAYPVTEPAAAFSDIASSSAKAEIETLARLGVVRGYDDGTFRPDNAITRLEYIVMAAGCLGLTARGEAAPFSDAASLPGWSMAAVNAAWQHGLVEGYDDGSLRPFQPATRSEAALILDRAAVLSGRDSTPPGLLPEDISLVPAWARGAVARGFQRGLLPSLWQGWFNPQRYLTRAEAAMMLVKI